MVLYCCGRYSKSPGGSDRFASMPSWSCLTTGTQFRDAGRRLRDAVPIRYSTAIHQGDWTMTIKEFRLRMEAYRKAVDEEAKELRDSYFALEKLNALYRKFDAEERALADQVLAEWVLSDDEGLRFDALVLIDDFKIVKVTPALRKLASRLAASSTPGAPYELQKVDRIIRDLT
jgi:hypothetical protein